MAGTKYHFTREMGSWLREFRAAAGLTQDEVATRLGLVGKGKRSKVSAIEAGRVANPGFMTIIGYLLACGTPVGRFCDRFNTLGLLLVDPATFEDTEFDVDVKKHLRAQTASQVDKFQRRIRFPRRGRRLPPEELKQRAEKYLDYQTQVKIVQQAVKELLARTRVGVTEEQAYLNYARMVLSALRKYQEPELSKRLRRIEGYLELHGLDEGIGRRIANLVIRMFADLGTKHKAHEDHKG
jgi:transcriptional regulator with XRE-family HTH domain